MKKLIFLFCSLLFMQQAISQTTFSTVIPTDEDEFVYDITETSQGKYLLAGVISENNIREKGILYLIDSKGNIEAQTKIIIPDSNSVVHTCIEKDNEYFCFGSIGKQSGTQDHIAIWKLNNQLELLSRNQYRIPGHENINLLKHLQKASGNHIIYGYTSEDVKTNINFDLLFFELTAGFDSLRLESQQSEEAGSFLLSLVENANQTGYYALIRGYDNVPGGEVLSVDSNFQHLNWHNLPPTTGIFGTLQMFSDTTFIINTRFVNLKKYQEDQNYTCIVDTSLSDYYYELSFGSPDTSVVPALYHGMDYIDKNNIFLAAFHNFKYESPNYGPNSSIIITKTDSLLNPVWEQMWGGEIHYTPMSIRATSDSGCIVLATIYDSNIYPPQQDIFILKTDADGNFPTTNIPEIKPTELLLYPNPGTTQLNIRTAVQATGGTFNLFDMQGRMVLSQTITDTHTPINTTELAPGSYIFQYVLKGVLRESGKWMKN